MKALSLAALFLLSIPCEAIEQDKKLHVGLSIAIGGMAQGVTDNAFKSAVICMSAGVSKEIYDEYSYGGFDTKDLIADAVGCALGIGGVKAIQVYHQDDAVTIGYKVKF